MSDSGGRNPPSSLIVGDVTVPRRSVTNGTNNVQITEVTSPDSLHYDDDDEDEYSSDDDEVQYCDCIVAALQKSLPGTPGKKGVIPYVSVYETQQQARRRGYWIPGVPVNAKITKVEKNMDSGIHFINTFLYTIELEHGKFKWSVVRNYKDFSLLHNRLMAHRAAERIRAPVRRAQERVDAFLEGVGVDMFDTQHREECPYYRKSDTPRRKQKSKMEVLQRTADAFDSSDKNAQGPGPVPLAPGESPLTPDHEDHRRSVVDAVQSGILHDGTHTVGPTSEEDHERVDTEEQDGTKKRKTRQRKKHTLPPFPKLPDYMVTHVEQRKEQLENWLQMLLHIPINRNHHETAEFLEISRFSFVNDLGGKHTEGFVKKRPGGARVFLGWKQCCVRYFVPWSKRWLMVRDSFVAYMDHRSEQIRLVLLMDKDFKVAAGGKEADGIPTGLIITNTQHELHLKCRRIQDTSRWKKIIEQSMNGMGNIWIQPHRFASSFPVRENSYGKWFVDSRSYMSQCADMMEVAREEIFIADWWLSPEIFMKRPAMEGTYWRLDQILKRKAEQGVKIFVLLYKEMEMALGLNSIYTKRTLQNLHPNIKVMRHPDHYPSTGTFFWAHHEKLVVIDQLIAFVGGVDLCFGRWDDDQHLLTDLGSVQFNQQHAVNQDTSLASGLRALVKAPLTLSPLGLEEDEEVVVRSNTEKPFANDSNDNTRLSGKSEHIEIGQGDDGGVTRRLSTDRQVTRISLGVVGDDEIDGGIRQPRTPTTPSMQEEVVFTDKETGGVRVKIWKRASKEAPSKYRHSTPPIMTTQVSDDQSKKTPTILKVVEDAKGRKQVRRSPSATEKRRTRIPLEVLEEAGPAPSMFEKATKSGMDMATAAEKYKEYVSSGAVAREKHRAQTPPPKRKEGRLSRAVVNWRSNRAKKKWRQLSITYTVINTFLCHCVSGSPRSDGSEQSWVGPSVTVPGINWVLDSDEVTAGYELDWLRLQKAKEDDTDVLDGGVKLWIGKDYVNYIHKDFVDVDMPFHDFVDRGVTPRMPWHDIHSLTFGVPARDVARHFIQRWNATKTEKLKDDINYPYLLPKTYENLKVPRVFKSETFSEQVNIQVLRSLSNWSGLINTTEDSIQMAYLSLIANSKHYIYIENQFFVSMIDSPDVLNEVCKVICNRIIRAYKEKQKYRVYIMIPLLPGFEGDVGAPGGSSLQAVLHWTYLSLSRGPNSLIERLKAVVPDPFQYLAIGSLRTHDMLCGKLVTELIYIHCKLLIVDDEHVIIGSANINDRSQVGNRDSEVCLLFSDIQRENSMMDGRPYQAGKFAKSLRLQCMKEHLALLPDSRRPSKFKYDVTCDDPVDDSFFVDVWQATARSNMRIYEEVFRTYPTDNVETFEEFQKWTSQMCLAEYSPQQAEERIRDLRGTLVEFPLNFLCKATLTPGITSKEGLVPSAVFT